MNEKRSGCLTNILFAFAGLCLYALVAHYRAPGETVLETVDIDQLSLPESMRSADDARYQMILLFDLEDEPAELREAVVWGETANQFEAVAHTTLIIPPGRDAERDTFIRENGLLGHAVRTDLFASFSGHLAVNGLDIVTPMKIIANPQDEVVWVEYGNTDRGLQQRFQLRVDRLIR